jgi:LmbE family N-acetylglucosaminyl deacetylase
MAILVTFHAHPDDEAIACGGTIAKAAKDGHRVVIVFATRGEHGEVADDFLASDEELSSRRVIEAQEAADILGAHRVEFLGYTDSGMMGTPENDAPGSFWSADVDAAAHRLAAILEGESADVLTIYDAHGTYGHPDHIQVHRVGLRAAEIASTPRVYESVANRDRILASMSKLSAAGATPPIDAEAEQLGVPESTITTFVDVEDFAEVKRAAMAAHASQIPDNSFFLTLPEEIHREVFGTEFYILRGAPPDRRETSLFDN